MIFHLIWCNSLFLAYIIFVHMQRGHVNFGPLILYLLVPSCHKFCTVPYSMGLSEHHAFLGQKHLEFDHTACDDEHRQVVPSFPLQT